MPKKEYQASIVIARPIEDTFNFTSDVNNFPLWSGASAIEVVPQTPERIIGSEYKVTFSSLLTKSTVLISIIEYNAPTLLTFQTVELPIETSNYLFEDTDEGTKVTLKFIMEQDPHSLFVDMTTNRKMEKLLANLKRSLEKT